VTKCRLPREGPSARWVMPPRIQNGKSGSRSGGALSVTS
jgi:hypothetical protein